MNKKDILKKIAVKSEDVNRKKEFTDHVFELIKDDCLSNVVNRLIDCDFSHSVSLHDCEIIDLMVRNLGLNTEDLFLDGCSLSGVERSVLRINFFATSCITRRVMLYDDIDESLLCVMREIEKERRAKITVAEELVKNIDYARLCTKLRSHIISNGFKGRVAVMRHSGRKVNILEFSASKRSFINMLNSEVDLMSGGKNDAFALKVVAVSIAVVVMILISIALNT